MPTFEVVLAGSPAQLPGAFIDLDFASASGNVTLASGLITGVANQAPPSVLAKKQNDRLISSWWDAVNVGSVSYDSTYFAGASVGAASFSASGQAISILQSQAPTLLAPQNYTLVSVTSHTTGLSPAYVFSDNGAANTIQMCLDDPTHSHHLTYRCASGLIDTGVVGTGGLGNLNVDVLTLDAGAPAVRWFRNGSTPVFTGTNYAGTQLGGHASTMTIGDNGSAQWFTGLVGRFMLFNRALSPSEAVMVVASESDRFGYPYFAGTRNYVPARVNVFTDPGVFAGAPSRINPTDGHPERYIVFNRGPYEFIDVVALPIRYGRGDVDTSSGFVPHFVEWPFMKTKDEPSIFQETNDPSGVCRLRLTDTGRYCFALYKPGAGAHYVHFNVEP